MYESFFQLTKPPFSLVSDPGCIHVTPVIKNVMRTLAYGVLERRGCLVLTAEPGLGKTTVVRALSDHLLDSNVQSSILSTPTLTSSEFLEVLMLNFGIQEIPASKARRIKLLEEFLIRSDAADRISVLVVDEAHTVSDEVLEEIRLLSNLEAGPRKLLQILLAGQTELNDRLNRPNWWQFKQRITTRLTLSRLAPESVADYIRFRWNEAGTGSFPFAASALDAIAVWSNGIPRVINVICHNALQIAFTEQLTNVSPAIVRAACNQLDLPTPGFTHPAQPPPQPAGQPLEQVSEPTFADTRPPDAQSSSPQEPKNWWLKLWNQDDAQSASQGRVKTSILSLEDHTE